MDIGYVTAQLGGFAFGPPVSELAVYGARGRFGQLQATACSRIRCKARGTST